MDAFDADCLIYAAAVGHPIGDRVAGLFRDARVAGRAGVGSTVLIPELLAKPLREQRGEEVRQLAFYLARLDLRPVDRAIASLAAALGARHRLRAADAIHLATAVSTGADRFITNNRRDFDRESIDEIEIVYPETL